LPPPGGAVFPVLPFELFVPPLPLPSLPFFDAFKSWSAFAAFSAAFFEAFSDDDGEFAPLPLNLLFVVVKVPPLFFKAFQEKEESLPDEKSSNRFIAPREKEPPGDDKNDSDNAFFVVVVVVKHFLPLLLFKLFILFEFTKISFRTFTRDDDVDDFEMKFFPDTNKVSPFVLLKNARIKEFLHRMT
jgi:hypothetical protein